MPLYRYRALSSAGKIVNGEMEAPSEARVIAQLNDLGHYPIRAEPAARRSGVRRGRGRAFGRRMSQADLAFVVQELARLVNAEIPVEQALDILLEVSERRAVRHFLEDALARLRRGEALAQALEAQGPPIRDVHVSMVFAGEAGGSLGQALGQLSDYMQRSRQVRADIVSASIYPCLLLGVSVVAVVFLLAFVVPRFAEMFRDAGAALPMATQMLLTTAAWLQVEWPVVLLGVLTGLLGLRLLAAGEGGRRSLDSVALALPLIGRLVAQFETARFSRTLSTLLANGVTLPLALPVVRGVLGNRRFRDAIDAVSADLKAGQGFAELLQRTGRFPPLAGRMIRVGEETGQLERMLLDIAEIYEDELKKTIKRLLAIMEPAIILTLGVVVGAIILSILAAILSINRLAF